MAQPSSYHALSKDNWREYLNKRGVFDDDVIAKRGYQWVYSSGKPIDGDYAKTYGFPRKSAGLLIPLHPLLGGEAYQLREAGPQDYEDSKSRKFRTPQGQTMCLATSPVISREAFKKKDASIVIAEGITRVDALAAYRIPALGLVGTYGWRGTNKWKGKTTLADWEDVSIKGSVFLLAPDGDVGNNSDVHKAIERLRKFLKGKGALRVPLLRLPDNQGLDDWIATNGPFESDKALFAALKPHMHDEMPPEPVSKQVKQAMTHPTPILGDAAAMGNWSCNPTADAMRLLRFAPDKLLATRNPVDGTWSLLVDNGFGVWQQDRGALDKLMVDSSSAWNLKIAEGAIAGSLSAVDAQKALKWAIEGAKPRGRAECRVSIGGAFELLKAAGQLPPDLVTCSSFDLDKQSPSAPSLGAPNGVIDLNTGALLPREEGRKRFVSRSVPDDFKPDVQHDMVDQLIAHVPDTERDYILAAVGFALRRIPARRMYLLTGEKRSGKTTLLNAIYGCLGDVKSNGYGISLDVQDLAPPRWNAPNAHSGGLFGVQDAAVAIVSEAPKTDKVTFNERLIRSVTGGDILNMRDVGEKSGPGRPASATLVMALNPSQLPGVDLTDGALKDRLKILDYPPLRIADADVDPMRYETVRENPGVRQALLALLVKACAETKGRPPQDTDTVTAAVDRRYSESIGTVGEWLLNNVHHAYGERLYTEELWAAVAKEFGPVDDSRVKGKTRRETVELLRTVLDGGLPKLENPGGKAHYLGLVLAPRAAEDGEHWCITCGAATGSPDREICGRMECYQKFNEPVTVGGGVDGEAARDAIIHSLVVKLELERDCSYEVVKDGVVQGIAHYGIGPDWTHCYCKKYQRPEKTGTLIDSSSGEPSPGWVLYVEAEDVDDRQKKLIEGGTNGDHHHG